MQFVDGAQRPPRDAEEAERLGVIVGAVHALTVDDLDGWLAPDLTLAGYLDARIAKIDERLPWVRDPLPVDVQRRLRGARSMLERARERARDTDAFQSGERLVVLHGDVAGGNLVWSPMPVLIDWEYARMGDAADEVAYIFNQNDLSEADRLAFWRGYRQGSSRGRAEHLAARVRWWVPVTMLGSAFFWVESWSRRAAADQTGDADPSTPRGQDFYGEYTLRRPERAESLLETLEVSADWAEPVVSGGPGTSSGARLRVVFRGQKTGSARARNVRSCPGTGEDRITMPADWPLQSGMPCATRASSRDARASRGASVVRVRVGWLRELPVDPDGGRFGVDVEVGEVALQRAPGGA